jgi:hypothetical protein
MWRCHGTPGAVTTLTDAASGFVRPYKSVVREALLDILLRGGKA